MLRPCGCRTEVVVSTEHRWWILGLSDLFLDVLSNVLEYMLARTSPLHCQRSVDMI
jgi:hypothetical protein